jgi:hypothetical protein
MKRIYKPILILVSLIILTAVSSFGNKGEITQKIIAAIQQADVTEINQYLGTSVDLTTPENDGTYSKDQATMILRDFFKKNPISSFSVNHQGASNDGSKFFIGTYQSNQLAFRVYCLIKKQAEEFRILQIQFEEE